MLVFWAVVAVLLVGAIWLITSVEAWGSVGSFFTDNSVPTIMTWSLAVSAVSATVGYALMRRATPRA